MPFCQPPIKKSCRLQQLGLMDYAEAQNYQKQLVTEKLQQPGKQDYLLLLEHPGVYTLGTGSQTEFLKFPLDRPPKPLFRTERGGEVTYHCPGQLVGYPILNLRDYQTDLHWYLRQLEEVIIRAIAEFGLEGQRIEGLTGVWLEGYKVAAIGIKVKRWITFHGWAVNVCPDLKGFEEIIPCGIEDKPVGSLRQFIPEMSIEKFTPKIIQAFREVFTVNIV